MSRWERLFGAAGPGKKVMSLLHAADANYLFSMNILWGYFIPLYMSKRTVKPCKLEYHDLAYFQIHRPPYYNFKLMRLGFRILWVNGDLVFV